jgi:hypothetical protein
MSILKKVFKSNHACSSFKFWKAAHLSCTGIGFVLTGKGRLFGLLALQGTKEEFKQLPDTLEVHHLAGAEMFRTPPKSFSPKVVVLELHHKRSMHLVSVNRVE